MCQCNSYTESVHHKINFVIIAKLFVAYVYHPIYTYISSSCDTTILYPLFLICVVVDRGLH